MTRTQPSQNPMGVEEHPGHENHMCELVSRRQMTEVAKYSKDARFICHVCGRAAASPDNLCEPVEI